MRTALVCSLVWLGYSATVLACVYPVTPTFELESDPQDTEPPAAPRVTLERVKRGTGPERDGCSWEGSSCDGTGYLLLDLQGDFAHNGYVLEVQGKGPPLARYLDRPLDAAAEAPALKQLQLVWEDGEGHQDLDFDIYVWSVDRAGNVSEEPSKVHVESSGAAGCAALSSHGRGGWLLALLFSLLLRRSGFARGALMRRP